MIYLDSSAITKLIVQEDETAALIEWLNQRADESMVTSVLAEVEVPRALRRRVAGLLDDVAGTLARLDRMEIDADIRATAAAYVEPNLRSLDAIHLATADMLVASGKTLTAFIAYDKRLAAAAGEVGLTVVAPGVP